MTRRDNHVATYLTDDELSQLKEWARNSGKSKSELLRDAILEYLDHDRAARVEQQIRDLDEKVNQLLAHLDSDSSHTHTLGGGMQSGSDSVERARKMVRRLQENHDEVVPSDDVERVIEDIAGADDRTLRKYKSLFRKRGLLYEHPGETSVWTTDGEQWCDWITRYAKLNGKEAAESVAQDYPVKFNPMTDGTLGLELAETEGQA